MTPILTRSLALRALALVVALGGLAAAGSARAAVRVDAFAARNGLEKSYPTRGFGDSDKVDVWVPFRLLTAHVRTARTARITLVVKPIGQLIGTDALLLRGASGKVHAVYTGFNTLAANRWSTVTVDLSGNADIMAAVRAGRLDGVVQDDTAVQSVHLTVGGADAKRAAVYIYDVFYQARDAASGRLSWVRYQSYFEPSDANVAIRWLQGRGYTTTWSKRFWRWGRA